LDGVFATQVHAWHSGDVPIPGGAHHVALLSQNVLPVAVSLYVRVGYDPVHTFGALV